MNNCAVLEFLICANFESMVHQHLPTYLYLACKYDVQCTKHGISFVGDQMHH